MYKRKPQDYKTNTTQLDDDRRETRLSFWVLDPRVEIN